MMPNVNLNNIPMPTIQVNDEGFYVFFDKTIGDLKSGEDIYLQLPHSSDSFHDSHYNEDTISECIKAINHYYTDESLSVMRLAKTANFSHSECREIRKNIYVIDENEDEVEKAFSFIILNVDEDYFLVTKDPYHGYIANNKAWMSLDIYDISFVDEVDLKQWFIDAGEGAVI